MFRASAGGTYPHSLARPGSDSRARRCQAGDGWIPPAKISVVARRSPASVRRARRHRRRPGQQLRRLQPQVRSGRHAESAGGGSLPRRRRHRRDVSLRCADQSGRSPRAPTAYPFALDKGWTTFAGWGTGKRVRDELEDIPRQADAGVGEPRPAAQPHRPGCERQRARGRPREIRDGDPAVVRAARCRRSGPVGVQAPRRQVDRQGQHRPTTRSTRAG